MAFGLTSKSEKNMNPFPEGSEEILRKNRRAILGLKLMVYTAVILLAGGFFYYHNALQSAQENFHREIQNAQAQIDLLMQDRARGYGNHIEETLISMKSAIANLEGESERVQELMGQVLKETDEFLGAYKRYLENRSKQKL